MRSDAYIKVTCDRCEAEEEISLTATAQRGYDERNVDGELKQLGWTVNDMGDDLCPECTAEDKASDEL